MKPPADLDTEDKEDNEDVDMSSADLPPPPPAPVEPVAVPAAPTDAAEILVSDTVENALTAAMESVLSAPIPPDPAVSADSTSGLVYVDASSMSKTDTEKSQEALAAALSQASSMVSSASSSLADVKAEFATAQASLAASVASLMEDEAALQAEDEEDQEMQKYL